MVFCALIMLTKPQMLGEWVGSLGIFGKSLFVAGTGVGAFFAVLVLFAIAAFLPRFLISLAKDAHPGKRFRRIALPQKKTFPRRR